VRPVLANFLIKNVNISLVKKSSEDKEIAGFCFGYQNNRTICQKVKEVFCGKRLGVFMKFGCTKTTIKKIDF
jgi:hypothetical protein